MTDNTAQEAIQGVQFKMDQNKLMYSETFNQEAVAVDSGVTQRVDALIDVFKESGVTPEGTEVDATVKKGSHDGEVVVEAEVEYSDDEQPTIMGLYIGLLFLNSLLKLSSPDFKDLADETVDEVVGQIEDLFGE